MERFLSTHSLFALVLFLCGIGDYVHPWPSAFADSSVCSPSLMLRLEPLDLEGILTVCAVSLWGLVLIFVVTILLYSLIRHWKEPKAGDSNDSTHLGNHSHSSRQNEVSTYYVYIGPTDASNTEPNIQPNT